LAAGTRLGARGRGVWGAGAHSRSPPCLLLSRAAGSSICLLQKWLQLIGNLIWRRGRGWGPGGGGFTGLFVLIVPCLAAGCGNVYLRGEAATAAETSTMDAYLASQKASADACTPAWGKAYLEENFRQWRHFVRAARKDANWGPKLPDESNRTREDQ